MNEATLTQLKIIVEQAVRPLRASFDRKRIIREELLAHVSAVFEEELARLADAPAALERTRQRFGSPAELTSELQTSVPRLDVVKRFIEAIENYRPGETTLRRALRHGVSMLLVFGGAVLPVFWMQRRLHEWPIIPAGAFLATGFTLASNGMREAAFAPSGRSWFRGILIAAASSLLIPGVTFGVLLVHTGDATASMMTVLPLMPWAILLSWVPVTATAYMTERELRYRREWETLPIEA
jgi:hypothetical protein